MDIGLSFFRIVRQKRPHLVYLTAICQMLSEKFKVDFPYQAGFISHLFVFLTFKKPKIYAKHGIANFRIWDVYLLHLVLLHEGFK